MMVRLCAVPTAILETRYAFVFAPNFVHYNYLYYRNIKHLVNEEIPGLPMLNRIRRKYFRFRGSLVSVLYNRYLQHRSTENVISAIVKEEQSNILIYLKEKERE
jgi:hypothetical protein